jgi:hypothetical protein
LRKVNQIPWKVINIDSWGLVLGSDGTYNERRNEPDNSGQEGKGLGSLPASTYIVAAV